MALLHPGLLPGLREGGQAGASSSGCPALRTASDLSVPHRASRDPECALFMPPLTAAVRLQPESHWGRQWD